MKRTQWWEKMWFSWFLVFVSQFIIYSLPFGRLGIETALFYPTIRLSSRELKYRIIALSSSSCVWEVKGENPKGKSNSKEQNQIPPTWQSLCADSISTREHNQHRCSILVAKNRATRHMDENFSKNICEIWSRCGPDKVKKVKIPVAKDAKYAIQVNIFAILIFS
jgi:hypothetical protein